MMHSIRTFITTTRIYLSLLLGMLVLGAASPVQGSSIVPPRDLGELAALSEAVVLARAGTSAAFARGDLLFTRTGFEVLDVVRGSVPARIDVETAGGVLGGVGWAVAGSPTFVDGTVYLLFLSRQGGVWRPRMLAYGLLEQVTAPDGSTLLTHIREHHDLDLLRRPDGLPTEPVETYYRDALVNHLRLVVQQRAGWDRAQVLAPRSLRPTLHDGASKTAAIPEPCVYVTYGGYPVRWGAFDEGETVQFYAESGGDADVDGDDEFNAVQQGIDDWKAINGVNIGYAWAGAGTYAPDCSDGEAAPDDLGGNQGLVQYNDPCNEIPDLSGSCSGTLAFGGAFFSTGSSGRHEHQGLSWNTARVGFIVVNNGVGACLASSEYRSMMTHELGHTLGFGHISPSDGAANMNPSCCVDITDVDETCALFSYSDEGGVPPPDVVVLEAPGDGATEEPATLDLTWQTGPNADAYHLQVATDPGFSEVVYEGDGLTQAQQQVGPLEGGTPYYWRVRAENAAGFGPWSDAFQFTTAYLTPDVVVLQQPADGMPDQATTIDFAWQEAANADHYQLQVSTDDAFTALVFEDDGVTQTHHEVSGLNHNTMYYWRVRGLNPAEKGPWSEAWHLTTQPPPVAAVVLDEPEDDAPDQPPTLDLAWQADPQADRYHVQVSTADDFSELVFEDDALTETTVEVGPLAYSTLHYWRVRAANASGPGAWSAVRRFTTAPLPPGPVLLNAPGDDAPDQPLTLDLTWQADPQADRYHVQVSTAGDFSELVFEDDALTQTTVEVGPLDGDATFHWRIRGLNASGPGPWSEVRRFTTALQPPGPITLGTPDDGAAEQPATMTLAWQADPQADRYHVQMSTAGDFSELVFEDDALTQTTVEVGDLAAETIYHWRVRATNAAGTGPWSEARRFTTTLFVPDAVVLASPEDDAFDLPGIVSLAWEAAPRAATYHVQVSAAGDFSELVFEDDALTETTVEVGPLAYSTLHYWRVRALNASGPGSWSAVWHFTLAVGTAIEPTAGDVPDAFQLYANYPNPFNPATTLRFDVPATTEVRLVIYDVLGRAVETLVDGTLAAGSYTYTWEAGTRPSGIYLARLETGSFSQTRQMLLVK